MKVLRTSVLGAEADVSTPDNIVFLEFTFSQYHKSPAAEAGEVARNQALKISRLFHEKMKTMVEI